MVSRVYLESCPPVPCLRCYFLCTHVSIVFFTKAYTTSFPKAYVMEQLALLLNQAMKRQLPKTSTVLPERQVIP